MGGSFHIGEQFHNILIKKKIQKAYGKNNVKRQKCLKFFLVDISISSTIFGYFNVRTGAAPGKSYSINHIHVHDVQPFSTSDFNVTHIVRHLRFVISAVDLTKYFLGSGVKTKLAYMLTVHDIA